MKEKENINEVKKENIEENKTEKSEEKILENKEEIKVENPNKDSIEQKQKNENTKQHQKGKLSCRNRKICIIGEKQWMGKSLQKK